MLSLKLIRSMIISFKKFAHTKTSFIRLLLYCWISLRNFAHLIWRNWNCFSSNYSIGFKLWGKILKCFTNSIWLYCLQYWWWWISDTSILTWIHRKRYALLDLIAKLRLIWNIYGWIERFGCQNGLSSWYSKLMVVVLKITHLMPPLL